MPRSTPLPLFVALLLATTSAGGGGEPVALQSADTSCSDDSGNFFVDCGNGTVTDNRSGLIWLADADCFEQATWTDAVLSVATLADITSLETGGDCFLSDESKPGEWRLPTFDEWQAMVADALGDGGDPACQGTPPVINNDGGGGCWASGPTSFDGVQVGDYWIANTTGTEGNRIGAVIATIDLADGTVELRIKTSGDLAWIWPVRGGQ